MPILILIFLAIAQYGIALNNLATLDGAVRAATAYAVKNSSDTAGITTVAQNAGGSLTSNATVNANKFCQCSDGSSVSCSGSCSQGIVEQYMQVSMTINYTPPLDLPSSSSSSGLNPALASPPKTLSAQAIMRMQ